MTFDFKPADIKRTCGDGAYQRGLDYWKQGNVMRVDLKNHGTMQRITSFVSGNYQEHYETHIRTHARTNDSDSCEIISECSCPVQINCKHVAATLIYLLFSGELEQTIGEDDVEDWISALKQAGQATFAPGSGSTDESPYSLLYILESNTDGKNPYAIELVTQKVRRLIKGGYGQPGKFPLEKASEKFYDNDFLQQSDRDVAQLITNSRHFYYYNHGNNYTLKREMGELALQKMLQTGRCHWGDKNSPMLRPGTDRSIMFEWQTMGNDQQLEYIIDPPVSHILRVESFWYVDLDSCEIGPLSYPGYSDQQVATLLDAPVIPADKLEEVSREIVLELPDYDLPAPVELDIEYIDINNMAPTPVLRLHQVSSPDPELPNIHCARLEMQYANIRINEPPGQAISRVVDGNIIYRVTRDVRPEQEAIDILTELNMNCLAINPKEPRLDWFFQGDNTVAESALQWQHFLEIIIPQLEADGWCIEYDESFMLKFIEADTFQGEFEEVKNEWFSLSLGVELEGKTVNLLPIMVGILSESDNPQMLREYLKSQSSFLIDVGNHNWLKLPSERLLPIFDTLVELYDHDPLDDDGTLKLSRQQILQIDDLLNDPSLTWRGADELIRMNNKLRDFQGISQVKLPRGFKTELREYQEQGYNWLQFLCEYEFNGILADDMGLGKTVQTLAHLLKQKQSGRMKSPNLIIVPTSLVSNWRRETNKFAPSFKVLVLHGKDRHYDFHRIAEHDIVITTYPLLRRDREVLIKEHFHIVVLDEAQYIKNPKSKTTQIVYELNSDHRLCLTGTPVENHLGEIWSMFHFLMPGYLGNLEQFNRLYRNPIEKQEDYIRREQLSNRIAPFLLRRGKDQVAGELPEKTEIIRTVSLVGQQRDLYESIRLAMDKKLRDEIKKKGLARSHIMILDALLKLRQCCCDPRLVALPQAKKVKQSAKLELLMDMVPEMVEEGRKILIFSQFTTMLSLIEDELQKADIDYSKLTGQTRKREEAIAEFQEGDAKVFLISLKAGGVGLNLTAADTVIHYDPWWNPAAENQATDRAHRIGQDKAVFVYKLITEDTVEDRILAMQKRKQELADSIYGKKGSQKSAAITSEDLSNLFQPLE